MHASQSFLGQGIALVHHPSNTKVHHLDGTIFQHHHIMRLDIPVNNAPAMGVFKTLGDLHCKMQRLLPVQHTLLFHILFQGNAVNQLHDHKVGTVRSRNVINLHNIGMAQHGNRFALCPETTLEFLVSGKFIF